MGLELDTASTSELDAADIAVGSMVYVEAEADGAVVTLKGGYVSDETFIAGRYRSHGEGRIPEPGRIRPR